MAIDWPEAIGAAPACRPERSGGWRPGDFLVSRGMPAKPGGEESRSAPLRHRRSRRSRPSARSAHQRGRLERSIRQRTTKENLATPSCNRRGPTVTAASASTMSRQSDPPHQRSRCAQTWRAVRALAFVGVDVRSAALALRSDVSCDQRLSVLRRSAEHRTAN